MTAYFGTIHVTGPGKSPSSITVQLFPYDTTPNSGKEYKVWMTKVSDHTPESGVLGFVHRKSKTDNFKVVSLADGDGVPHGGIRRAI